MGTPLVHELAQKENCEVYVTSRVFRNSDYDNVFYLLGDAHDMIFLNSILSKKWDAIVDFMYYSIAEFQGRVNLFLKNTNQYIFISSGRVYADSVEPITEDSKRLLDTCDDRKYVESDEYAIVKAKEENLLFNSNNTNWTIVRPYITYNSSKMQLGVFQKEQWLYRVVNNKKIIFSRDIASRITSYTYGPDVASVLSQLVGNEKAMGEVFNVANDQPTTWGDIIECYNLNINDYMGKAINILWVENSEEIQDISNRYQIIYDRLYNRTFNNDKIRSAIGEGTFTDIQNGICKCIKDFRYKQTWEGFDARYNGWADKKTKSFSELKELGNIKNALLYCKHRFW